MYINKLIINNFKCFNNSNNIIELQQDINAIIGQNSSGKTAVLEALLKLFGTSKGEREIYKSDFYNSASDNNAKDDKKLTIEAIFCFNETDKNAIPEFFESMVIDAPQKQPYLRIRLEARWQYVENLPDGEIEIKYFYIKVPFGEKENDDSKKTLSPYLRSLIQIFYIPAIREPIGQLRFVSGSILHRMMKKIKWNDGTKETFSLKAKDLNNELLKVDDFKKIQTILTDTWREYHKDSRYSETNFSFGVDNIESILKKLEIEFQPTELDRAYNINNLGEGYRSLFYFTLVCTLLEIEKDISNKKSNPPALTILAIEEPENHISPQLLGRVINNLKKLSTKSNAQVVLTSHTPAIIKRISPEAICHLRINKNLATHVSKILLPEKQDEAYQFIKQAVQNYPEIYFARLVIIGEGDSEEIIISRLAKAYDTNFDDNFISFAPLGHRFVDHIWKLLNQLEIPYITLLDYDRERTGGAWGRIKYILEQLIDNGKNISLNNGRQPSKDDFANMHNLDVKDNENQTKWIKWLEKYDIYYSYPLDLDFMLLQNFKEEYKTTIPQNGGPIIPNKSTETSKYNQKLQTCIQATLKSEDATGVTYSEQEKELMIWYNYYFLGRSKPSTHIQAMSNVKDEDLKEKTPEVLKSIFKRIDEIFNYQKNYA